MLSRFVIAFLPSAMHLLTSWLQSLSTAILEPEKIKSVTVSIFFPIYLPWSDHVINFNLMIINMKCPLYVFMQREFKHLLLVFPVHKLAHTMSSTIAKPCHSSFHEVYTFLLLHIGLCKSLKHKWFLQVHFWQENNSTHLSNYTSVI